MFTRLPALLLALLPSFAAALEETCLLRLADAAEALKQCRVQQITKDQCEPQTLRYERQLDACRLERFTPDDIATARHSGESRVSGAIEDSPFQRQESRASLRQQHLTPALTAFSEAFDIIYQAHRDRVPDGFDSPACPLAFVGNADRFRYVGRHVFRRSDLERNVSVGDPVTWHFVERMAPGRCVAAPVAGQRTEWGAPPAVNLPRALLSELVHGSDKQRVYICDFAAECHRQRDRMMGAYQGYLEDVARWYVLERCDNPMVGILPSTRGIVRDLDRACPSGDPQHEQATLRERLQQTESGLFSTGRFQ